MQISYLIPNCIQYVGMYVIYWMFGCITDITAVPYGVVFVTSHISLLLLQVISVSFIYSFPIYYSNPVTVFSLTVFCYPCWFALQGLKCTNMSEDNMQSPIRTGVELV